MKFEDLIVNPMEILTQISTKLKLDSGKKLNEVFQSHRQSYISQVLKHFKEVAQPFGQTKMGWVW